MDQHQLSESDRKQEMKFQRQGLQTEIFLEMLQRMRQVKQLRGLKKRNK